MVDISFVPYYHKPLEFNPGMKDYNTLWDSIYQAAENREIDDWYQNYARLPGDLVPEYNVKYWRTIGHWWWKFRLWLWDGPICRSIMQDGWSVRVKYEVDWDSAWRYKYVKKGFWNWWGHKLHPKRHIFKDWLGFEYYDWENYYCPYCGFKKEFIPDGQEDWFRYTGGGKDYWGQYWMTGEWTCPRCLRQWEYEDGS